MTSLFKRFLITLLIIFTICFIYQSNSSQAATINVPGDFATIQEAIDDPGTVNGDTINIGSGTHIEAPIYITKELIIEGQGIGSTILQSVTTDHHLTNSNVFYPQADNVSIRDLTIQDSGFAFRFEIEGGTIDNTRIESVHVFQNNRGIEFHNDTTVSNLTITNSIFEQGAIGLRVASTGHLVNITLSNNVFDSFSIAIYVSNDGGTSSADGFDILNNTFEDNFQTIYMEEGSNVNIIGNEFLDNWFVIEFLKWYQPSRIVSNVVISDNYILRSRGTIFSLLNADNDGGQTEFSNINISNNYVADSLANIMVRAGAHSSGPPSAGGIGWDTVNINDNCFFGLNDLAIFFFPVTGIDSTEYLAGNVLDVSSNYWGTNVISEIEALIPTSGPTVDFSNPLSICHLPPPPTVHHPILSGNAGELNTLSVTGAPGVGMEFYYGFQSGSTDVSSPSCPNLNLDILNARWVNVLQSDGRGNASMDVFVPANFVGLTLMTQVKDGSSCEVSNMVTTTFAAPRTSSITMSQMNPGQAGENNSFSASDATPDGQVTFLYGFTEQTVAADSICPGLEAGILNPRTFATLTTNGSGSTALVSIFVPASFSGISVVLQAVDMTTCTGSNVVSETF